MTKVKVFEKKVEDQRVKVRVSNERSCQKEYISEIGKPYQSKVMTKVKVFEKKVKDQRVKLSVSNERSCQKEYT
jgi:hypothetical protein